MKKHLFKFAFVFFLLLVILGFYHLSKQKKSKINDRKISATKYELIDRSSISKIVMTQNNKKSTILKSDFKSIEPYYWNLFTKGKIDNSPIVADSVLYIIKKNGILYDFYVNDYKSQSFYLFCDKNNCFILKLSSKEAYIIK